MLLTRNTGSASGIRGYGVSLAASLVLTIAGPLSAGEVIRDADCKFVLRLPEGFKESPVLKWTVRALVSAPKKEEIEQEVIHCCTLSKEEGLTDFLALAIMRLPPIKRLSTSLGPRENIPGTTPFTMKWRGFDIAGLETPLKDWTGKKVLCMAEVNLKPNSIILAMTGPAGRKAEIKRLLQQTLDGLDGEMNYDRASAMRYQPSPAYLEGRMIGIALVSCVVVIGLLRLTRWLPKGCVLVLALLLSYAWGVQTLLGGMVGVFGAAIGIVDLVRQRQPTGMPPLKV